MFRGQLSNITKNIFSFLAQAFRSVKPCYHVHSFSSPLFNYYFYAMQRKLLHVIHTPQIRNTSLRILCEVKSQS